MQDVYTDKSVAAIIELHSATLGRDRSSLSISEFLSLQADTLLEAHSRGDHSVLFHLACWCKPLIGKPHDQIMDKPITLAMAQQTIASEYGYTNWTDTEKLRSTPFNLNFENCVDAMLAGDAATMQSLLESTPELATQRSQHGHRASLLHYLAANGVESYRQVTPFNAALLAHNLLEAGAEVNATANIYGGSQPLGLLVSSAHPANAGVVDDVAEVFRMAGAI